jgi:hypothetical protein
LQFIRLKRTILVSLLLVLASTSAAYFLFQEWSARKVAIRARLLVAIGPVFIKRKNRDLFEKAKPGEIWLQDGDRIKTGRAAYALYIFPGGYLQELAGNGELHFNSIRKNSVTLLSGSLLVRSNKSHKLRINKKEYRIARPGNFRFWKAEQEICQNITDKSIPAGGISDRSPPDSAQEKKEQVFPADGSALSPDEFQKFSSREDIRILDKIILLRERKRVELYFVRWMEKSPEAPGACTADRTLFIADFAPVQFRQNGNRLSWNVSVFDSSYHLIVSAAQDGKRPVLDRTQLRPYYFLANQGASTQLFASLETRPFVPGLARYSGKIALGKNSL